MEKTCKTCGNLFCGPEDENDEYCFAANNLNAISKETPEYECPDWVPDIT